MTTAAAVPLKKPQDSDAQTFGVGNKYSLLLFKQRSSSLGDHALIAIGKRVQVDSYIDGSVVTIVRCSPAHFRVELSNGQAFIVAEEAVQAAVELRPTSGPVAA